MTGLGALFRSHFVLLVFYSLLVSLFFALMLREGRKRVLKFFCILFAIMTLGVIALGWLMVPFPR